MSFYSYPACNSTQEKVHIDVGQKQKLETTQPLEYILKYSYSVWIQDEQQWRCTSGAIVKRTTSGLSENM